MISGYNISRWYRSGWGRYTQADPLGVAMSDINPYTYVGGNPVLFKDPSGLVKIKQGFQRLGGLFGGGGEYSLGYGKAFTNGKCVGCGSNWQIELSLFYVHRYYCTGSDACSIELTHANIASAFVSKAAETYKKYEQVKYSSKELCESMAQFYAESLKHYITNPDLWDDKVKKDYLNAQNDYEQTHHGWCAIPWACTH